MGAQQQTMLGMQLARQLADQQSEIEARVPGLLTDLQQQDYQKAQDERDYQFRVAQLGLEQGRWSTEQQTGEQHWAAEQKRAEAEQQLAEREFGLRKTTAASELAARRAGITGRYAPTLTGRQSYWSQIAEERTKQDPQGRVWIGTPTGIKPATAGKGGAPLRTADWVKQQAATIMATGLTTTGQLTPAATKKLQALGIATAGGTPSTIVKSQITAQTALKKAQITRQTTLTKAAIQHQDTLRRLQIQQQGADTAAKRAQIAQQVADEHARYNRWKQQHPTATAAAKSKLGTAPRRTGPGTWTTRAGTMMSSDDSDPKVRNMYRYWEGLFQEGYITAQGKRKKPIPPGWRPSWGAKGTYAGGGAGAGVLPKGVTR
jgi:hypothetical protein